MEASELIHHFATVFRLLFPYKHQYPKLLLLLLEACGCELHEKWDKVAVNTRLHNKFDSEDEDENSDLEKYSTIPFGHSSVYFYFEGIEKAWSHFPSVVKKGVHTFLLLSNYIGLVKQGSKYLTDHRAYD